MRVLFTTLPAIGHFHSIAPLAQATAAAGHAVAVACTPAFADDVAARKLEHLPCGLSSLKDIGIVGPPPGLERDMWCWREVFAGVATQRFTPALLAHAERWRPDLIVRASSEYAGCIVAERLGLPHAAVASESWAGRDDRRRVVGDVLSLRRVEAGLPPDDDALMMHRYLHLCFAPPAWDGALELYPATAHFIRHVDPERPGDALPEFVLARTADRPLVLASLGTVKHATAGVFAMIVDAFRSLPVDLVAAIGRDQDTAQFGALPPHIHVTQYVAQPLLLRHCAMFVTHGGFNSVKEAASVAVPFVVIPISGDQHYSGERIAALGLGRVAAAQRSVETIASTARAVLADDTHRVHARAFAEANAALPPIAHAVALLERLAAERRPILRS
jgi:UDP:flavonoid glycosyltransferase YjiC (YdhE family)